MFRCNTKNFEEFDVCKFTRTDEKYVCKSISLSAADERKILGNPKSAEIVRSYFGKNTNDEMITAMIHAGTALLETAGRLTAIGYYDEANTYLTWEREHENRDGGRSEYEVRVTKYGKGMFSINYSLTRIED